MITEEVKEKIDSGIRQTVKDGWLLRRGLGVPMIDNQCACALSAAAIGLDMGLMSWSAAGKRLGLTERGSRAQMGFARSTSSSPIRRSMSSSSPMPRRNLDPKDYSALS